MTNTVPTRLPGQVPGLDSQTPIIGGVAGAIASRSGVSETWVRLGFVAMFAAGGWGALLYIVSWAGLAWFDYLNRTHTQPVVVTPPDQMPARFLGLAFLVGGIHLFSSQVGGLDASTLWPFSLIVLGGVVSTQRLTFVDSTSPTYRLVSLLAGLAVAAVGVLLLVNNLQLTSGPLDIIVVASLSVGALVTVSAPWWRGLVADIDRDRRARLLADERADVAAHLHDSVLQTLTLIQRESDSTQVKRLARSQERELRNWIAPGRKSRTGGSLQGLLDEIISDVEAKFSIDVETVVVGDRVLDANVELLLGATREAIVNAGKHSGQERVDVYVEVGATSIDVFVRDTGVGFVLQDVPADRQGVTNSIKGRMDRAGGTAEFTTAPGEGTEVALKLPITPEVKDV